MRKFLLISLLAIATVTVAQEKRFVIRGEMSSSIMCYSTDAVKEVRLEHVEDGQATIIATAAVENNKFIIEGTAPEKPSIYNIAGFDNGSITLFLEEGEIFVGPFDAAYPVAANVGGTPCNDIYQKYLDLHEQCIADSKTRMKKTQAEIPDEIKGNPEAELKYTSPTFYVNNLHFKVAIMDFVYNNLDSPVVLYIIKFSLLPTFTTDMIQEFLNAVPQSLHSHKVYKELVNEIRAANLKVGAAAPDISGRTPEGKELSLSDFKGKYVFIDVWASWCAPCRREIPYLKKALAYSEKSENLVVLSYSIDNKEKDWTVCITNNKLTHKNWIHISTLKGWGSEAVKLLGIKGVPYTLLIDPDGNVVEFNLRGEQMVNRLMDIVDGTNK